MSWWTQVNCEILSPVEIDMDKVFGKKLKFPDSCVPPYELYKADKKKYEEEYDRIVQKVKEAWDDYEKNPDEYLPVGSEGSLSSTEYKSHGTYVYHICGSLRDRSDDHEIVKWFQDKFLKWINDNKLDSSYGVYGRVEASNGVGKLVWTYDYRQP